MDRFLSLLLLFGMFQTALLAEEAPPAVTREMKRLESCRPVFKLTPAPVNARVVWTQPFDLVWKRENQSHVSIEFSVQYAQSDFFQSRQEAENAQDFNPLFDLRHRSHYVIEGDHLKLLWRESLIEKRWKRESNDLPEFACWQTIPNM
jgi:hypothetical protein